ncbi:MAG: glycosyltransferase family 2 protein [Caldilineaceae bacterium]
MTLQNVAPTSHTFVANADRSEGNESRTSAPGVQVAADQPPPLHRYAEHWPSITVVIPTLNEAENLPHVLPQIPAWVDEVLLVDGHSTDSTVAVARELRPDIRIIYQQGRGKGAALRTGFAAAAGDIIVMLDADGSTDPGEIPAFIGALLSGADFAKGSRFLQGGGTADMPLYRKLGNFSFVLSVRMLFGGNYSDLCYGYNAFWRHVVPRLKLDGDGFEIETMMNIRALRAQLKIAEVPSFEAPRVYGIGRLRTIPDGWRVLKTIIREWLTPHTERLDEGA